MCLHVHMYAGSRMDVFQKPIKSLSTMATTRTLYMLQKRHFPRNTQLRRRRASAMRHAWHVGNGRCPYVCGGRAPYMGDHAAAGFLRSGFCALSSG